MHPLDDPRRRHVRARPAQPERGAAAARGALEVRLQEHQVHREASGSPASSPPPAGTCLRPGSTASTPTSTRRSTTRAGARSGSAASASCAVAPPCPSTATPSRWPRSTRVWTCARTTEGGRGKVRIGPAPGRRRAAGTGSAAGFRREDRLGRSGRQPHRGPHPRHRRVGAALAPGVPRRHPGPALAGLELGRTAAPQLRADRLRLRGAPLLRSGPGSTWAWTARPCSRTCWSAATSPPASPPWSCSARWPPPPPRAMIRRLGRRWQKLHRLVYVAAIAAVVHFLWLVKADSLSPAIHGGGARRAAGRPAPSASAAAGQPEASGVRAPAELASAPMTGGVGEARDYPSDVHVVQVGGREFVLVGTAHVSRESADLVREVIEKEEPRLRLHRAGHPALRGAVAQAPLGGARPAPGDPPAPAGPPARQSGAGHLSEEAGRGPRRRARHRAAGGRAGGRDPGHPGGTLRPRRAHHAAARLGLPVPVEQVEAPELDDREPGGSTGARRGRAAPPARAGRAFPS